MNLNRRPEISLWVLALIACTLFLLSNKPEKIKTEILEEVLVESECSSWLTPKRVTLAHVEGVGTKAPIGFGTDYSTFAVLLASDYERGYVMPMVDLRAHRFDNGTWAANFGVGGRYIPCNFCELVGLNAFYDYRQGFRGNYSQVGVGLEILAHRWDLRANAYVPVGNTKVHTSTIHDYFVGNYYVEEHECESTSYGYNLELGWLMVETCDFLLYLAGGPYYLTRKGCFDKPLRGGEVRLRPQFRDYLAVDLRYSYDSVFESVFQVGLILYLPVYQFRSREKGPCCVTDRQIYQPIERFEVMPLVRDRCFIKNY